MSFAVAPVRPSYRRALLSALLGPALLSIASAAQAFAVSSFTP